MDNDYTNIQKTTNIHLIVFAFVMTILATLVTSPALSAAAAHDSGNQKSKDKNKPKDPKCNNVLISSRLVLAIAGKMKWEE